MNELQVKTVEIKPAVIKFNHEDIEKDLNETLKYYKDLVFTEDATTDLRKTLSELRKGKSAIHDYGVDTRRELNVPVKAFSGQIKGIESKFDSVIDPLNEQLQEYVERERDEKLRKLEEFKAEFIVEHELCDHYAEQVEIEDSLLNKSTSLKVASESIEFRVKNLKMRQDKDAADKSLIETTVKLVNAENDLSLSIEAYIRLLEFHEIEVVKKQIEWDAQKEVEQREERERIEKERVEREKQAELERIEREENERIESENKAKQETAIEPVEFVDVPVMETKVAIDDIPFADIEEQPFIEDVPVGDTFSNREIEVNWTIKATPINLENLKKFMNENGIEWSVK